MKIYTLRAVNKLLRITICQMLNCVMDLNIVWLSELLLFSSTYFLGGGGGASSLFHFNLKDRKTEITKNLTRLNTLICIGKVMVKGQTYLGSVSQM